MFGTRVSIFSYYPPGNDPNFDPKNWPAHRDEVVHRMRAKAELAAKSNVVLFHENEHRVYGDSPERVADILGTVDHPSLRAAYDAANYTYGNFDPVAGWEKTKAYTAHFHIKDWKKGGHAAGHEYGVIAGTGDGNIAHSIRGAVALGYKGFATMEPHLRGGGPTGGITGPDLFRSRSSVPQDPARLRRERLKAERSPSINDAATGEPTPVRSAYRVRMEALRALGSA